MSTAPFFRRWEPRRLSALHVNQEIKGVPLTRAEIERDLQAISVERFKAGEHNHD